MDFEEFYHSFFDRVYNYARYRTDSAAEAEDLTSAIFGKLYKCFKNYDKTKASLAVWTFTVARSVSADFFRWKKIRSFFSLDEEGMAEPSLTDDSAAGLEAAEEEKALASALAVLDEREKELVNLHFYQQLKQTEIAAVTGLTQSHVGVLLHRAVRKMKHQAGKNYEQA